MVPLDAVRARSAFAQYRSGPAFFPLIGAVLEGTQDGVAYADDAVRPRQVYVEHAFGFAQVFGAAVPAFEAGLQRYLLEDKAFAPSKVRLYTPLLPGFLDGMASAPLRAERQRFRLPADAAPASSPAANLSSTAVTAGNFAVIERSFGVALRFWRSAESFISGALPVVALLGGRPAAICYAAARSDGRAEIDVLTLPEFRHQGAGQFAVEQFIRRCGEQGVEPLWDCFTNNAGSLGLCRSAGFEPAAPPYPFFTIDK